MILAAGRGERLRPLTMQLPKALVPAGGKPLIEYHLEKLAAAGIRELVINLSWLGEQIEAHLGDGARFGVNIRWSREMELLETGGGIRQALPWLGEEPFAVISADVWSDYDYRRLPQVLPVRARQAGRAALTFSGIAVIAPALVREFPPATAFPLREALAAAIAADGVRGDIHPGCWSDVGTPERLADLRLRLGS